MSVPIQIRCPARHTGNQLRPGGFPPGVETGNVLNAAIQVNSKAPGNPSDSSIWRDENLILPDTYGIFPDLEMRRLGTGAGLEIEREVVPETGHHPAADPFGADGSLVVRTDVVDRLDSAAHVEQPDLTSHHRHQLALPGRDFLHRSHVKEPLAAA